MGEFVADATIKQLILAEKAPKSSKVVILGLTFKENCPDIRNSKVIDIISRLKEYDIEPIIVDPWAIENDAKKEYDLTLSDIKDVHDADCIIITVSHDDYKNITVDELDKLFKESSNDKKVIIDVKSILNKQEIESKRYRYWRL